MDYTPAAEKITAPAAEKIADPKAGRRYLDTVATWLPLGYTVIPSLDGKKPAVRWRDFSSGRGRIPRRPRRLEQKRWNRRFGGCPRGCLILDSHRDPSRRLVVIDIDVADEALLRWAEREFGVTPLIVTSGRGWHIFYRAPAGKIVPSRSGMIGPEASFEDGVSPIDVKASGAYVIAAGSWHEKRGVEYAASQPISASVIDSLPVFDLERYEGMVAATKKRRAGAKRGTAPTGDPHTSSIQKKIVGCVDRGTLASDTYVELAAGGGGTLASLGAGLTEGGYISVQCPLHPSDNGNASLRLSGGRLRLTCFGDCSGASYRVIEPILAPQPEEALDAFTLVDPEPSVAAPDNGWGGALVRRYRAHELALGQYLPHDPLTSRITLLRAGLGAGKTEMAAALALDEEGDVEVVAPRRSLIDDTMRRYGARLIDYRTVKGDLRESHAVCLDSIHRIQRIESGKIVSLHGKPIGLLILDEIRTIRHALTSGCMDGYESLRCLNTLRRLLRGATRVLVADALAERVDLEWVAGLAGVEMSGCEVRFVPPSRRWTYKITGDEIAARAAIRGWVQAGERLAIPMMASQACEALGAEIKGWRPGVRVEVVTAATIHDLEARGRSLRNINSWIGDVDVLIYSPSLGTGFSIDVRDHFDRIVALAWQNVGTAQDLAQMLHRVRHPKSDDIHIWIRPYGSRPDHRIETIEGEWLTNISQTVAEGAAHGIDVSPVPMHPETGLPYDMSHWKTALGVESDRRFWGAKGGLSEAFADLAARKGWTVEEWEVDVDAGEAKALRETKKEARAAVRLAHAEAVVAAPVIAASDARAIREPENREEALAVERAGIAEFYGIDADQLSAADVLRDDGGKRRAAVAAWGRATLLHQGRIRELLARDVEEMGKHGVTRVGATGGRARATWAKTEVLRWFGIDLDAVLGGGDPQLSSIEEKIIGVVDQAPWPKAIESALRHRRALGAVGIGVPRDIEQAPARLLGSVLKKLGLGLEAERVTKRVHGTVERSWRYRITGVAGMRRDAAAYIARWNAPAEEGENCPTADQRALERLVDEVLNAA